MPTPLPPGEKSAFIAIVQAAPYPGGPFEAQRLEEILNNYEDVYTAIMRQLPLFASNNAYLIQAITVFDNTQLQAVGIWVEQTISSPSLTDPVLIINSTISDWSIVITAISPPIDQYLAILGTSVIERITVLQYAQLLECYIGPGVVVNLLDASAEGAAVNIVSLPVIRNVPSKLNGIVYNSQIGQVNIGVGSYFGGYTTLDPLSDCQSPVTDLAIPVTSHNTIQLIWTPPNLQSPPLDYLFINTYYRPTGSNDWIPADENIGVFNGDSGFTFTTLEQGTDYQFEVIVTCKNGGLSAPAAIEGKTTCCD